MWHMLCLPAGMLTLGRDGMQALGLGLHNEADLRRTLHFHQRDLNHDEMPEDEDANDLFKQLECKHPGDPCTYIKSATGLVKAPSDAKYSHSKSQTQLTENTTDTNVKDANAKLTLAVTLDSAEVYVACHIAISTTKQASATQLVTKQTTNCNATNVEMLATTGKATEAASVPPAVCKVNECL